MQDSIYLAHSWFRHIIIRNKSSKVGVEGKINATEATCKRWKRKLLGGPGACPLEKFWDLVLLVCISSILERKLECLNRTQTSLIFGFGRGWGWGGGYFSKKSRQRVHVKKLVNFAGRWLLLRTLIIPTPATNTFSSPFPAILVITRWRPTRSAMSTVDRRNS